MELTELEKDILILMLDEQNRTIFSIKVDIRKNISEDAISCAVKSLFENQMLVTHTGDPVYIPAKIEYLVFRITRKGLRAINNEI